MYSDSSDDESEQDPRDFICKLWRFFDSVEGFYTGSLDLTGRHHPRFESVIKRWNAFLPDFKYKRLDTNGDVAKWEAFKKKWNIPNAADFDLLVKLVLTLVQELIKHLKRLRSRNYILDMVFSVATIEQARLLSSTCKMLRISEGHLYSSRNLTLEFPYELGTENNDLFISAVETSKENLLKKVDFLLSRSDILDHVNHFYLRDEATPELKDREIDHMLNDGFHKPIWNAFTQVIYRCQNLTQLRLIHIEVPADMLRAVVLLPQLVQLAFTSCVIPEQSLHSIHTGIIAASSSVLNLDLIAEEQMESNIWDFIACCSNLRTLSIRRLRDIVDTPSIAVVQHSKVFCTLQKLVVGPSVNDMDAILLARWIVLNSLQSPLQLTHLKISTMLWLDDAFLFPLINALQSAPLQVLVLDGIKEGSFELFDRIAESCSQLLRLTTMRRENSSQRRCKLATWPHASWEYAPHFAAFQRLEHFSWNFRVGAVFDSTPAAMRYFEEGPIRDYYLDAHYIAYPFAACCPTLKSFAIDSEAYFYDNFCNIHRRRMGLFVLKRRNMLREVNQMFRIANFTGPMSFKKGIEDGY
ncbi:hypothetical protein BDQ17DRAFT_1368524 [Cyathus striatus]|nr:hypothetical protein BDQ17DRAFT_1368524 [Cyathus striatus]